MAISCLFPCFASRAVDHGLSEREFHCVPDAVILIVDPFVVNRAIFSVVQAYLADGIWKTVVALTESLYASHRRFSLASLMVSQDIPDEEPDEDYGEDQGEFLHWRVSRKLSGAGWRVGWSICDAVAFPQEIVLSLLFTCSADDEMGLSKDYPSLLIGVLLRVGLNVTRNPSEPLLVIVAVHLLKYKGKVR